MKRFSSGTRILVVDDDAGAAWSLAMILELQGYDVGTALDGESALQVAASFQPELSILDIAMPNMDGYELSTSCHDGRRMGIIAARRGSTERPPLASAAKSLLSTWNSRGPVA